MKAPNRSLFRFWHMQTSSSRCLGHTVKLLHNYYVTNMVIFTCFMSLYTHLVVASMDMNTVHEYFATLAKKKFPFIYMLEMSKNELDTVFFAQ